MAVPPVASVRTSAGCNRRRAPAVVKDTASHGIRRGAYLEVDLRQDEGREDDGVQVLVQACGDMIAVAAT